MERRTRHVAAVLALAALLVAAAARAEGPAGSVAALEGNAEVLHPGAAWTPLGVGDPVKVGDQLRTQADAKLKVVFQDDSVLTVGPASTLAVTEQTVGAAPVSSFSLLVGSLRALVTERYAKPGARFEVETPTAIAGVRGTGFIAQYDPTGEETTIVGLYDTTLVRAHDDTAAGHEVRVGPGEATKVRRGSYPIRPSLLPEDVLRGFSAGTTMSGALRAPSPAAPDVKPSARRPRESAAAPQQIIDQPVGLLRHRGRGVAPPPPPAPPPAR
jgi:hypothetical protein